MSLPRLSRRLALLVAAILLLAGCGRGPDEAAIRRDVANALSSAFGEGTFEIVRFERQGHSQTLDGREIVYFKTRLALARDLELAAWQGPNALLLAAILGSGPKGLYGIQPKGNHAGDVVAAFGSATYRAGAGGWTYEPAPPPAEKPAGTPPAGIEPPTPITTFTRAIESSLSALPRASATEVVEAELEQAQRRIEARLARLRRGYALASGPQHGEYWRFGSAVSTALHGGALLNIPSAGSGENIRLLEEQLVDFAIVQSDVAASAFATVRDMRALAALFPEPVHVIVPASSEITRISDLAEKKVATGAIGSGSRIDAMALIAAAEIPPERIPIETAPDATAALTLIANRAADAVIFTIASPSAQIRDFAARTPIRLVPIDGALRQRLRETYPSIIQLALPPGVYAGQLSEVQTVASTAILVTRADVPAEIVTRMLKTVFDETDYGRGGSVHGLLVRRDTARSGISIPLHAAADAFYNE